MSLDGRPIHQKPEKAHPRPDYLDAVRSLPCCVCEAYGEMQRSPTTAHHPIMGRHGTRKRPDVTAIPLCDGHHQGTFDTSKIAVHRDRAAWLQAYGEDTDFIAVTQDRVEREYGLSP